MPDLQIKIQTLAELSGAKQAERELEQNIGKAKALGKDFSGLEAKLQAVRKSIQEYEGDLNKNASATDKLSLKKAELKKLVKEIGHEFPILGSLGRLAMNPIAAGASLAVVSVTQLFVSFKKLNDFFKSLETPDEKINVLAQRVDAQRQVATDAAIAQSAFARSLKESASAADILKQRTEDSIAAIKKLQAAEDEKANKRMAIEKAQVDKDEADGKINHITALQKKQAIEDRYQREAIDRANAAQKKQLDARRDEAAQLEKIQLPQAQKKEDDARAAAEDVARRGVNKDNNIERDKTDLEARKAKQAELKKQLEELLKKYNVDDVEEFKKKKFTFGSGIDMEADKIVAEQLEQSIGASGQEIKKLEAILKKEKEQAAQLRIEAEARNAELKAAEEAVKKGTEALRAAKEAIRRGDAELKNDAKNREENYGLDKTLRTMQTDIGVSAEKKKEADAAEREKQNQSRAINSNKFSAVAPDSAPLVAAVQNMPSAVPLLEDVVALIQKQSADNARKFQELHQRINDSFNV